MIVLDLPEDIMVQRLKDGVNFNDTDETIIKRIRTFVEETQPVMKAFIAKSVKV